ncbi:MAG: Uncharacterised protein [Arcobacter lacus]|nr:MAG: Uncharacterised protein [Arcobacter lacus]
MGNKETTPKGKASFVHIVTKNTIRAIKVEC